MYSLSKSSFALLTLFFLAWTTPSTAQDALHQIPAYSSASVNLTGKTPQVLHITDKLAKLPASTQAIQDFQRDKLSRINTKSKTQPTLYSIGSRATFRVMKNLTTMPSWEERSFTLAASSAIASIWVEDNELGSGNVTDTDIDALESALLFATPEASINPTKGIVENNNVFFGSPPDVDGDGQLDILLYDITEGGSNNNFYVAGFVTPSDLSTTGGGNNKDVLYLDTNPGISGRPINSVLATAAHEYQHLIHFNYDFSEQDFVNEGLSEWAEILNGYPARSMTFLNDPFTYNVRLLAWESGDDILDDYQRAGLFTGYLAERMTPEAVASVTRNANRGRRGYEEVLNQEGLDFEEVLKDYHTANLLNNTALGAALDPAFQYFNPAFNTVGSIATYEVDGFFGEETPPSTVYIEAGGVQYLVWQNVADFSFNLDTSDPFETLRERVAIRVLLEEEGGQVRFEDLDVPQGEKYYAGPYDRITLIVAHVDAELTSRVGISYDAVWGQPVEGMVTSVSFDNGSVTSGTFFSLSAGASGAVATRFELPEGETSLLEVGLSPYYVNQFPDTEVPANAPRDLMLKLWDALPDGTPGDELFSLEVTDPRTTGTASSALNHFNVDLSGYRDQLSDLPNTFFIGYAEAGSDANYMVIGPSDFAAENRSYVTRNNGDWGALWDTQFSDGGPNDFPLQGTIAPIRAIFTTSSNPVSTEDEHLALSKPTLHQNFPNPFTQHTSINYSLPQPEQVKLVIYNLLGQRVKTLVDQFQVAGNYSITFQADSLPSGSYLYTLEANAQKQTRHMIIIQ